ncbi:MAG TPA: hypothetical protein VNS55_05890 [Nocardioides sp.]|nr:hypothetical protein [Nocardioides sp.]
MTGGWRAGAVVLAGVAALAVGGCSDGGSGGPSAAASSTPASSVPPLPEITVDPSEAAADPGAPPSVGEFCAPYVAMRRTIEAIDYGADDAQVAAQLAPVMREWAAQVPDLAHPPGIDQAVWDGLQLLARRILALPEEPTLDDIEGVEDDLDGRDRRLIVAASSWFADNCLLEPGRKKQE